MQQPILKIAMVTKWFFLQLKKSLQYSFALLFVFFLFFRVTQLNQIQAITLEECNDKKENDEGAYTSCLNDMTVELQGKIATSQQQAQTLTNAINIINTQAQLQQIQIAQTQNEINLLEKELINLAERINGLSLSLDRLTQILIVRSQASYKQTRTSPILALFTSNNFPEFITQLRYLQEAEKQIARAMQEAETQRLLYNEQKDLKEIKQAQLEEKRAELQKQRQELEQNKANKQKLLAETKNSEATYQRLLHEAEQELSSYKSFVLSTGQLGCASSPVPQPDGWFYSQRDPRWCKTSIGNSSWTIGSVGCYITSVAMIWKKYGNNTNPVSISSNPNNFWLDGAYMKSPPPIPPGYKYYQLDLDKNQGVYTQNLLNVIDKELNEGRPTIVKITVSFNSDGTHFIVLKSGNNGKYIMNDPLYEADLPFDSKYSTSQITSVRTFTPN